jgi:hypothetical protein
MAGFYIDLDSVDEVGHLPSELPYPLLETSRSYREKFVTIVGMLLSSATAFGTMIGQKEI